MSNRIDLEALDEISKKVQEMCYHERLLRVSVFTTEPVVRELIAELKRCYEKLDNLKRLVTWDHTDSDNIASDDDLLLVLTGLLTSE